MCHVVKKMLFKFAMCHVVKKMLFNSEFFKNSFLKNHFCIISIQLLFVITAIAVGVAVGKSSRKSEYVSLTKNEVFL